MLTLLSSPLLGPAVWRPTADQLATRGWSVTDPPARHEPPRTPSEALQHLLAAVPADPEVVLVPHSNAGLYVPTLVERRRVVATVFVDAGLPPAEGEVPLAPPPLYAALADLVDPDGLLPPWTKWWDSDDVDALFPTAGSRRLVEREQPRLPLRYFAEHLDVPAGWDRAPGAYLAFGDTYAADRTAAAGRRWPTRTMPGRHLHMLMDPGGVARQLTALLGEIGVGS